jgi:hypothetical protein
MPDWAFYRHSGSMHPCMSTVQVHAAWPKPCCVSMSMLHVHVHAARPCPYSMPCPCFMFMSMLHFISMLHSMSRLHSVSMLHSYVNVSCPCLCPLHTCRNAGMPDCPVPDWKKLTMPGQVQYRTKLSQSGIFLVRYRTKIRDVDADANAQLWLYIYIYMLPFQTENGSPGDFP